ncbi:unnamed protein product [Brugia timori]|uniref:HTH CENPB-type domain-containing protein n=1 Tax=Brugia timori TaxID=42155 RepID=A0A0R3R8D2_9BILA|nr:unnamed protein product [Brugia timori]
MSAAAATTAAVDSSVKDKGEPDWSLEDVDCVLHWIAGGTISERKGTELLNVIFGKSLSRYTVRSKVKALKEKERISNTTINELKESSDNDNESQYRIVEVESVIVFLFIFQL